MKMQGQSATGIGAGCHHAIHAAAVKCRPTVIRRQYQAAFIIFTPTRQFRPMHIAHHRFSPPNAACGRIVLSVTWRRLGAVHR